MNLTKGSRWVVTEVHPMDDYYENRDELIGRIVVSISLRPAGTHEPGYFGGAAAFEEPTRLDGRTRTETYFYGIALASPESLTNNSKKSNITILEE